MANLFLCKSQSPTSPHFLKSYDNMVCPNQVNTITKDEWSGNDANQKLSITKPRKKLVVAQNSKRKRFPYLQ
jgi:hypothetical protein